jgi:fructose-bisphosphate aldolase class 1
MLVVRGVAAAYLEILHKKGMTRTDAADFIVRELDKIGISMVDSQRRINRKTIITWRDKMNSDITGVDLNIYRQITEDMSKWLDDKLPLANIKIAVIGSLRAIVDEGLTDSVDNIA